MDDLVERLRTCADSDMVPMEKAMKLLLEAADALEAALEPGMQRPRAQRQGGPQESFLWPFNEPVAAAVVIVLLALIPSRRSRRNEH